MKSRQYQSGIRIVKNTLKTAPLNLNFWYYLGMFYDHLPGLTNEKKAIACYEKIKELDPKSVYWAFGLGRIYWHRKDLRAVRYYKKAYQLSRDCAGKFSAMVNIGNAYMAISKFRSSENWYLRCLRFLPRLKSLHENIDRFHLYFALADLYKEWGKYNKALKYARLSVSIFKKSFPNSLKNTKVYIDFLNKLKNIIQASNSSLRNTHTR